VKFSEIAGRITGFSTPIFGVSWTPPQVDVDVARGVLVYLEDRRVLYSPYEAEVPDHCIASVLEIRRFLTEQLARGGIADELAAPLVAMRAACRKFLDALPDRRAARRHMDEWGTPGWVFNQALGEPRGVFGVHVAQLAVRYGIDVPDPLVSILPLDAERDFDPASEL
jgi:hypothetical protein